MKLPSHTNYFMKKVSCSRKFWRNVSSNFTDPECWIVFRFSRFFCGLRTLINVYICAVYFGVRRSSSLCFVKNFNYILVKISDNMKTIHISEPPSLFLYDRCDSRLNASFIYFFKYLFIVLERLDWNVSNSEDFMNVFRNNHIS